MRSRFDHDGEASDLADQAASLVRCEPVLEARITTNATQLVKLPLRTHQRQAARLPSLPKQIGWAART